MKPVIVVTGADLASQAVDLLLDFELVFAGKTPDETNLVKMCKKFQPIAMIVRYGKVTAQMMDASKNLRVISKHGVGIDTIDIHAAAERTIMVKTAIGANAAAVAEHTWGLILACAKSIVLLDNRMRSGHWDKATHKSLELKGKTLGLVGFGSIGQRVADVGVALEMRVITFDPYAAKAKAGIKFVSLDQIFSESDVISLHCPLTSENRNMVNRETIERMRDGAVLVNTARGGLIDEASLLLAIKNGKLGAAGLDSFANEPLADASAFSDFPNVILSPHVAGVTKDAYINMGVAAARNILAALEQI